ncbi:formate--tetrahydrofolate ligase [Clostridia bacterium]|nr:formate--tetrahydrofolate ligase [Clostridia bacterium]
MKTDMEIAREAKLKDIEEIAASIGIEKDAVYRYGQYKAKIVQNPGGARDKGNPAENGEKRGKLILVTAVNPTAGGEGKTTVSIGLADALRRGGVKAALALREPSLGPVFGMKGGATGGGYAQVVPMEDINLHFNGDFHAVTAANNLLCAMIDNHIHWGNVLDIDVARPAFRRCVDVNDRALRNCVIGLGGTADGKPREEGFDITAASEIMAVLCLSRDAEDLRARLKRIVAAYDRSGKAVTAGDLKADGAMAALLKDAMNPNLVQTLEGTPAFIHGGPFANIAHGCNSVIATRAALRYADCVVTEAGFGADLGAEKFIDIKCRTAGLEIACVVLVATVRALKLNGGARKEDLKKEDLAALAKGLPNLVKHIENITKVYKQPCVVALNRFDTDTAAELQIVEDAAGAAGVKAFPVEFFAKGGAGGPDLAREVLDLCKKPPRKTTFVYGLERSLEDKIASVAKKVYGADGVNFSERAKKQLARMTADGFGALPVCIAKTQYSLSDDPARLGAPNGFTLQIREVALRAGAGFVVAMAGEMLLMPGLPKTPNAENIGVDASGDIYGIF